MDMIDSNDCWIGDIDIDLETGVDYLKTVGTGDSVGVGDRLFKGGTGTGYRGAMKRGDLLAWREWRFLLLVSLGRGLLGGLALRLLRLVPTTFQG